MRQSRKCKWELKCGVSVRHYFGAAASKRLVADTVHMRRSSVVCTYNCACVYISCVCQVIHTYTTTPSFTLQWNPESTQGHCVYTCLYRGMSETWNKTQEPCERKGKERKGDYAEG